MPINVVNFYNTKSIKLSDAFVVEIQIKPNGEFYEYYSCTGFTLPKLENTEETMFYGNTSQTFVIPNYDSCKDLTLEFYETFGDDGNTTKELFFENYKPYHLEQTYGKTGLSKNRGVYVDRFINAIRIKILDNTLYNVIYEYLFEHLKITNYTLYGLDYADDNPCKISITFSFENLTKRPVNIPIKYSETAQSTDEFNAKSKKAHDEMKNYKPAPIPQPPVYNTNTYGSYNGRPLTREPNIGHR